MRAVLTKVKHASVTIDGELKGKIGRGFLILLGVAPDDTEEKCRKMADKLCSLRIFDDENDKINLSLDRIKKMENQNDSLEEQNTERLDENTSTPSERMIQKDKLDIVRNIIDELPEKQRSCLQLRDIEGKSYKEIADILCITEDQVKVNIFRARQTVKQRFQQFDRYGL